MTIKTTHNQSEVVKASYQIPNLPMDFDIETKAILRKTNLATRALAELKGVAVSMPNQSILINTLSLQEAKDSSAIENIITTHDELYQSDEIAREFISTAAKEVHMYAEALKQGYLAVKRKKILHNSLIKSIQAKIEGNTAGFRTQVGTSLKNEQTGKIIYTPPQQISEIEKHMANLEEFVNNPDASDWDALVKMAIIHHQFESIHPFFDGNGRTGRILNILYLVKEGLLDTPVLYLSRYINQNKPEYYRLLQEVRDKGAWEEWILFILEGVHQTSYQTIRLIENMKRIMQSHKQKMRSELKNIYTQDLLNLTFSHPYTKTSHVERVMGITRPTATKYLNELVGIGLMTKIKIGRDNYYINTDLMSCLKNVPDL